MKKTIILVTIALVTMNCKQKNDNNSTNNLVQKEEKIITTENILPTESELEGYPISHDTKVIETIYVIDRNGVDAKQEPNEKSKSLMHYNYGDYVDIIEVSENFYTIKGLVYREWREGQSTCKGSRWEKVFIKKDALGDASKIELASSDLNVIVHLNEKGNSEYFEKEQILDRYFNIELIDESTFDNELNNKVDYFITDTANIKKIDGTIVLKTEKEDVILNDNPTDNDSRVELYYEGQYEILNQYVVYNLGWEWWKYSFYDKNTGEEQSFGDFPYLSPNQKQILCVNYDPYGDATELMLYEITEANSFEQITSATFTKWQPFFDENTSQETMFWSSDGNFYLKAIHVKSRTEAKPQYLRIKLLD